jgi:hypothetical protein
MAPPFTYRLTKAGEVIVSRGGRVVLTLGGPRAARLRERLGEGEDSDQQLLARATGNYRRGNERLSAGGRSSARRTR